MRAHALVVTVLVGIAAVHAPIAHAQPKPKPALSLADLDARVARLEAQLAELEKLAVELPSLAKVVQELAAEVAVLRQDVDQLRGGSAGQGELVGRVDALERRVTELGEQVASLRADLEAERSPEKTGGRPRGGGGRWDDGFWLVEDGRFTLRLTGLVQLRYTVRAQEAFDSTKESGFSLRRARVGLAGQLYSPRLAYELKLEAAGGVRLLDAFVVGELPGGFSLRGGQMKVPFSRIWMNPAETLSFLERPVAVEELRYDRDLGVWGAWSGVGGRVVVGAGVWNGAGPEANANDNVDPLLVGRVQVTPLGAPWDPEEGDLGRTSAPALTVGAAGTFENTPVPESYGFGSAQPLDTDVDADGERDNVRVWQAQVDVAFRWRGLGVEAEGFVRGEDWGVIPVQQATPFAPRGTLWGGAVQASYVVIPERLQLGARYSRTDVSLLLGGRERASTPPGDELSEVSGLVQYQRHDHGIELGAMWSFIDWTSSDGVAAATQGAGEQRFLMEAQVRF
jgi:outer membrane murein-binding lipoprotein Lpp